MRAVVRYLLVVALVLSTCAMRTASAHAQELTAEQERPVLALIGAPGEASVLMGEAPDGFPLADFPPDATVLGSVMHVTFERADAQFRRP